LTRATRGARGTSAPTREEKETNVMKTSIKSLLALGSLCLAAVAAQAQVPQYGANINLEQAKKTLAGAIAEARKMNIPMAVAIVDNAGQLVAFERMDNTQTGSVLVAQDKASSAAMFRRPTKVFQDVLAAGGAGTRILMLRGANAVEGGVPIVVDGRIIGGIGVSGGSSEQDGVVAKAGTDALAAR
jgi:glc operon protein GlcG